MSASVKRKELIQRINLKKSAQREAEEAERGGSGEIEQWLPILSLIFGLLSVAFRWRIFALLSLGSSIVAVTHIKTLEMDIKQFVSSFMVSIVGLMMTYSHEINQMRSAEL